MKNIFRVLSLLTALSLTAFVFGAEAKKDASCEKEKSSCEKEKSCCCKDGSCDKCKAEKDAAKPADKK